MWTFGDAVFYGDTSNFVLNGPVLDSITTPSGQGYYMVASDGGVFAFEAGFRGLRQPRCEPARGAEPNVAPSMG